MCCGVIVLDGSVNRIDARGLMALRPCTFPNVHQQLKYFD